MKPLSMTRAWNETTAFVRREAGLLFPIALGLVALPTTFVQALAPTAAPGTQPEPGAWMLVLIPAIMISLVGQLTIVILALGREVVVRDALALAIRRFLPTLGAALLFGIGMIVLILPFLLIAGLMGNQAVAMLVLLPMIVALCLVAGVRLLMLTPVGAAEALGPIAILRRSWALTRGNGLRLFGLLVIVILVYFVIAFAVSAVGGILIYMFAGPPEPGSISFFLVLLLSTLLNTVFVTFFATLTARIYAQLSETAEAARV